MEFKRRLKLELQKVRPNTKATFKDIEKVINAYERNNFTEVFKTRLYNDYGSDYCTLLELIYSSQCKDY